MRLPERQVETGRIPQRIDGSVDFCALPIAAAPNCLGIAHPFFVSVTSTQYLTLGELQVVSGSTAATDQQRSRAGVPERDWPDDQRYGLARGADSLADTCRSAWHCR